MAQQPKIEIVDRDKHDEPILGRCSVCGGLFKFKDTPEGRRVEEAFLTHECTMAARTGERV